MNITTKELKKLWIKFFTEHNHVQIGSSSIVPDNDSSVLFTSAGMQPLVPYLLGQKHPQGKRLCDYQKCVRTNDIDNVGDDSHLTFFEMLGSWSLGDYFKKEILEMSYEFLTSKKYLNLPLEKIAVTCFEGDENSPKDIFTYQKWKELGIYPNNIFYLPKENNWWALGDTGPCGPDTEMFYITDKQPCGENCNPACDCGRYLEIWNDVFMAYTRNSDKTIRELKVKNVDTGMGLERTVCVLNGYKNVYEIDSLKPAIKIIEFLSNKDYQNLKYQKAMRIIADHVRASTIILGDETPTAPSNIGRGYILRRLIRRSVNYCRKLDVNPLKLTEIISFYIDFFKEFYENLEQNRNFIIKEFESEVRKFQNTIQQGLREFEKTIIKLKNNKLDAETAFKLYDTFGFPFELTKELADERKILVDEAGFNRCFKEHQEKSRAGNVQVFKGGLAGTDFIYAKYHTATHILLGVLRKMFGTQIFQKGSNITHERLRFDFNFDRKLEKEELKAIEDEVNRIISEKIDILCEQMPLNEAKSSGAVGVFDNKYGDVVNVYSIKGISKEICGGPHANNTSELGTFKIVKEESSSAGVRRIKAILN